ncbi:MAG: hypothetical protein RLZZ558_1065 [Planctomycetota bacterium]
MRNVAHFGTCAWLWIGLLATAAVAQGTLPSSFSARLRMADGRMVSARIERWDGEGCTGDQGRLLWADMAAADVNRTLRRCINDQDPRQLLLLGRALLSTEDGETMGDSTLRQAVKRDGSLRDAADVARAEAAELRRKASERRVRAALPGQGRDGALPPWPIADEAERQRDLEEMKSFTEEALAKVRGRWMRAESAYWVVYADLPQKETNELAARMDRMYLAVADMFALPRGLNLFHGKGVCVVSASEEMFRAVEMAAFGQMAVPGVIGLCHMIGPKVIVNAWRSDDDDAFMATLVHEATHGVMHRYGTPGRLPLWAEEGYAEFVAARSFDSSRVDAARRPQGVRFIRDGGSTLPFFLSDGGDGAWPGDQAQGYAIGYLTVCMMIDQKGAAFGEWVKEVKTGVPWQQALQRHFGVDAEGLSRVVEDWYRRNP